MGLERFEAEAPDTLARGSAERQLLNWLGTRVDRWVRSTQPWTNVYGLARTLLAVGTASTLAFTPSSGLFRPAVGVPEVPVCAGPAAVTIYCLFPGHLEVAQWASVVVLLVVATGWRPRFTGLAHWWLSYSLHASAITLDGGDQVTEVLTLLLLPVTLTDPRRWHWEAPPIPRLGFVSSSARLLALSCLLAVRVQVAAIYFHASTGKLRVEEWANGTAVYYWFTDPSFGAAGWLRPALMPLLTNPFGVALLTWGALFLEIVLFMALVMPTWAWGPVLVVGILFHAMIGVVHGLVSFSLAMIAALVLYLRPCRREFDWLRSVSG